MIDIMLKIYIGTGEVEKKDFSIGIPDKPTKENLAAVVNFLANVVHQSIPVETPKENVSQPT